MSAFKDTLKFVSNHKVGDIFHTSILNQYILEQSNIINDTTILLFNYIIYLINANYIRVHSICNYEYYYEVINEIPEPSTLTIKELKKLGDVNYRIAYMRKLKLTKLKDKLNVNI